jgi:Ca2+-binding EF-hand superfamily protein
MLDVGRGRSFTDCGRNRQDESMNDQTDRPPKKTEMIEVRVSLETKRDFLVACKGAGRSASDVIREGMLTFIDGQARVAGGKTRVLPFALPLIRKRYLAAGVAAMGLASFAALPSAAAPDLASMFKRMDANGDGVLSRAEFSAKQSDVTQLRLRTIKRDDSGKVVAPSADDKPGIVFLPSDVGEKAIDALKEVRFQDLSAVGKPAPTADEMSQGSFVRLDADKDGQVSLAEYEARLGEMISEGFRKLDANADGSLDAGEYAAIGKPVLLMPVGSEPAFGVTAKYGALVSSGAVDSSFAKLDANKDGKLSLQEYLPAT